MPTLGLYLHGLSLDNARCDTMRIMMQAPYVYSIPPPSRGPEQPLSLQMNIASCAKQYLYDAIILYTRKAHEATSDGKLCILAACRTSRLSSASSLKPQPNPPPPPPPPFPPLSPSLGFACAANAVPLHVS